MSAGAPHLDTGALLAYWLGETDEAASDAAEQHLMACEACGAELEALIALGDAVRQVVHRGEVAIVTGDALVHRLAARGARVREYRVDAGGSIACTLAPDDDALVTRLQAPLAGVRRLDLRQELLGAPGPATRLSDLPFDAARDELVISSDVGLVRRLGAFTLRLTLLAVDDGGAERELSHYTFHHTPWPGAAPR